MLTPFRGFWDTQSEIDRMFNDMMRNFLGTRRTGGTQQLWAPGLEAFARDGDLVLHYDLPGVGLEDVDITLDGNVLTISGERKALTEEGVNYYLNELPYGALRERRPGGCAARRGPGDRAQEDRHRGRYLLRSCAPGAA